MAAADSAWGKVQPWHAGCPYYGPAWVPLSRVRCVGLPRRSLNKVDTKACRHCYMPTLRVRSPRDLLCVQCWTHVVSAERHPMTHQRLFPFLATPPSCTIDPNLPHQIPLPARRPDRPCASRHLSLAVHLLWTCSALAVELDIDCSSDQLTNIAGGPTTGVQWLCRGP